METFHFYYVFHFYILGKDRQGRTEETQKEFCDEAILMAAGLIQLPAMIASVVGVCDTKTPSLWEGGCAALLGGQFSFTDGVAGSKHVGLNPAVLAPHTSSSCCLLLLYPIVAGRSRKKSLGPVLALD